MGGLPPPSRWSQVVCHPASCCIRRKPGCATHRFIVLSSGGSEAHTTLRNGCHRHRHCKCVCDLVPWHTQESRLWVSVCELLAYRQLSPPLPLMTPYPDRGMLLCSLRSVFTCLLTCAMSLPFPPGCVSSPVIFALNHCFYLFSQTSYPRDPGG